MCVSALSLALVFRLVASGGGLGVGLNAEAMELVVEFQALTTGLVDAPGAAEWNIGPSVADGDLQPTRPPVTARTTAIRRCQARCTKHLPRGDDVSAARPFLDRNSHWVAGGGEAGGADARPHFLSSSKPRPTLKLNLPLRRELAAEAASLANQGPPL